MRPLFVRTLTLKEFAFCKMQVLGLQRPCSNISIVKLEHVATGRIITLSKKCITVLESFKNCLVSKCEYFKKQQNSFQRHI